MKREQYKEELDKIYTDNNNQRKIIENRIENILYSAGEELGNYFISKGFIHVTEKNMGTHNYYYDKKTRIGFKILIPTIYLDCAYNILSIIPVYKLPKISNSNKLHNIYHSKFWNHDKRHIDFAFMSEEPKSVFYRFKKKYMNKQEIKKTEENMKMLFPKEMQMLNRKIKLEEINKKWEEKNI